MTDPLMPEVQEALREAVARGAVQNGSHTWPGRHDHAVRRRRRRQRWPHGLPLLLGGMLVAGSGVAAGVGWNPFAGEPNAPRAIRGPAPAEQRASLGILRRPQRPSDRTPLVTAGLSIFRTQQSRGVYVDAVRVIGPTESGGYCGGSDAADGRMVCHHAPATAFIFPRTRGTDDHGGLPDNPDVPLCSWSAWDTWDVEGGWPPPGSVPAGKPAPARPSHLRDRVSAGGSCTSMHQVRMKGLWVGGSLSMGHLLGVVPDGVAAVRVATSDGQVVTQDVRDNVVKLDAPGPTHRFHQGSLRWLDASGKVIRRF